MATSMTFGDEGTVQDEACTDAGDAHKSTVGVDADVLRKKRQEALRELEFGAVAERKAVNGCAPMGPSSPPAAATASHSCLTTPPIDMSKMGGSRGDVDKRPRQQPRPLDGAPTTPTITIPEAGLHRDGDQARLVESARRRQRQQRRRNEETTFQWLEESASQFWESVLVYGGLIDDPRNDPIQQMSRHSTMPLNPYRDGTTQTANGSVPNQEQRHNNTNSTGSKASGHATSPRHDVEDSPSIPPSLSNQPRIIRIAFYTMQRTLFLLRWMIDECITRLARLDPLKTSLRAYSRSPVYSLHVTADDILRSLAALWISFFIVSRTQYLGRSVVVATCLFLGALSQRVGKRYHAHQPSKQPQADTLEKNAKQSTARKEAMISPSQPKHRTHTKPIAAGEHHHVDPIQRLLRQYPNATQAECRRFYACVKKKEDAASKRMEAYLKWRSDCGLTSDAESQCGGSAKDAEKQTHSEARIFDEAFSKRDEEDWNDASKRAISIITKAHTLEGVESLPQIICSYEEHFADGDTGQKSKSSQQPPRCTDGTRILHILPSRLDLSLATAPTYSLAAALYLDRRFCRSSTERIALFCDVRGGRGWANPTPWSTLPFIQSTASLLGSNYPERLERLVLFPMPTSAAWVWGAAQKCLDPNTASKVVVVGSAKDGLPEKLAEFVDEKSLDVLEKRRRSFFVGQSRK